MYSVGGVAALGHEHGSGDDRVEQRRNGDVLPVRRGVGIDGDAMREVTDLALGQPHVIPGVGLEEIDARAPSTSSHGAHTRRPAATSRMMASMTTSHLRIGVEMIREINGSRDCFG